MNLSKLWEESYRKPFIAVRETGGYDRNRRFHVIGVADGRAFGAMLFKGQNPRAYQASELSYRDALTEGWVFWYPPAPSAPVPHYPAITKEGYTYSKYCLSRELFANEEDARKRFADKFIGLATHIPAIMLSPLSATDDLE